MDLELSLIITKAITTAFSLLLAYGLVTVVYNLWFHPLAKFPGPKVCAVSNLSYCYQFLGGRQPYEVLELHQKYGPVVRVAPNDLSFNTAQSWKDIYDFRPGHRPFVKGDFYDNGSFADQSTSIVTESDPTKHGEMRKLFSHAFSLRSLSEQEPLVAGHIDNFIDQIGRYSKKDGGIDLGEWFNILAFDIIGDLAFGRSFEGIKNAEAHPWVKRMLDALTKGALVDCFKRFPLFAQAVLTLLPGLVKKAMDDVKKNEAITNAWVIERRASKSERKDFMTKILDTENSSQLSNVQIASHTSDIVLAGSDTTAVTLTCIEFYLSRKPEVLHEVQAEIRTAFNNYEQINAVSTSSLKYLHAVCLEALRMYPPVPLGLPRVVPQGGDTVDSHYIPVGTTVSTNPVATSLSSANFSDPFDFQPQRWLSNDSQDELDASQPFSLGARGCIGRNLAWMELHTTLAKLHYKYNIKVLDDRLDWHRDSRMNTLWRKPALMVAVFEREG